MAALMFASSCVQEEGGQETPEQFRRVTINTGTPESKTILNGNDIIWDDDDKVTLVFTHASEPYSVTEFSTTIEEGHTAAYAEFAGQIASQVGSENGYRENGFAVYPHSAVNSEGSVIFNLPSEQQTLENGTFKDDCNLSSSAISLADIEDDGEAQAQFRNALSYIRVKPAAGVTSITITGTAPLAGQAPLQPYFGDDSANGRLVIDNVAEWTSTSKSITLTPPAGAGEFDSAVTYNVLIWPGVHTGLTITLIDANGYSYTRTVQRELTFEASKYYTLNPYSDLGVLDVLEGNIEDSDDKLSNLEGDVDDISNVLNQIQSVALMSEYLDNAVYAQYSQFTYSVEKQDVILDYIVRPAAAASLLVEKADEVMSVLAHDKKGKVWELGVRKATLAGDIMTVSVNASEIPDSFYKGTSEVELALVISDGNTEIMSDFANLVPKAASLLVINGNQFDVDKFPVLQGARIDIPYQYAVTSMPYEITVENLGAASVTFSKMENGPGGTGYIQVVLDDQKDLADQAVRVVLSTQEETYAQTLRFVEAGKFTVVCNGSIDWIGGFTTLTVTENDFGSYTSYIANGGEWLSNNSDMYEAGENTGEARTASVYFMINNRGVSYTKTVSITQNEYNSQLQNKYYGRNIDAKKQLSSASNSYNKPLNLVILGEGYTLKELEVGGTFERRATSAMDIFFGNKPFKDFKDRFNVYMFGSESKTNEIPIGEPSGETVFGVWRKGDVDPTYVNISEDGKTKIDNIVSTVLGLRKDTYDYYRTIVILLVNSSDQLGSTLSIGSGNVNPTYVGDGFASFAIAMIAANNINFGGLIRHEAGGHAFGRLADEYRTNNEKGQTAPDNALSDSHSKGYYRNICTGNEASARTYFKKFIDAGYEYSLTEGGWAYDLGIWRFNSKSLMYDSQSGGDLNAPSRYYIYERIIEQTEGQKNDDDLFNSFIEYEKSKGYLVTDK